MYQGTELSLTTILVSAYGGIQYYKQEIHVTYIRIMSSLKDKQCHGHFVGENCTEVHMHSKYCNFIHVRGQHQVHISMNRVFPCCTVCGFSE